MDVLFSILLPCYNSAAYVAKAIESVINQTYPHWELIVIDDGSKDNTYAIVSGYANNDNRIKVLNKENGGYATALNYGLDYISGDYFLFLGSDDYLDIRLLERLTGYFEEYGAQPDMVAFRTRLVDALGNCGNLERYTTFEEPLYSNTSFKDFSENDKENSAIFSIRDTSRCYKTTLLGATRYFGKTGIDSDGIFSMLLCHKAQSFLNVPVDGYYWYVRSGSVSSHITIEKHIDRILNWHCFFKTISEKYENDVTSTEKAYLVSLSHFVVELAMKFNNAKKYRRFIKSEAKFVIEMASKFNVVPIKHINLVSKMPILFSLIYSVYALLKKR